MARARYFLVALVGVAALAGCGESTLDVDEIENKITPEVEEQTGTKNVEITCPDDVEVEEGADFECDLTAEGGIEAKVAVTQEDDEGNVRWKVVQP